MLQGAVMGLRDNQLQAPGYETLLVHLVEKFKLSRDDLRCFKEHYTSINLYNICLETPDALKVQFLHYLLETEHVMDNRQTLIIPTVTLPGTYSYLNLEGKYDTLHYSPGVYHSREHEYFIGYLYVDNSAMFCLTDGRRDVTIKISAHKKDDIRNYVNKVVIIKNLICFTEIYHKNKVDSEYFFCQLENIHIWEVTVVNHRNQLYKLLDKSHGYTELHRVLVLNVCQPNSTHRKTVECWVHVLLYVGTKWHNRYLCLAADQLPLTSFLDERSCYQILARGDLIAHDEYEIRRAAPVGSLHKLRIANIWKIENSPIDSNIDFLSVEKICLMFKQRRKDEKYVNVDAVISLKVFANPDKNSRTWRQIDSPKFGTPGEKVHVLQFKSPDNQHKFSLYLNNWERKQVPYGLIPNMRVIIRHVEFGTHYLRSTGLTSISILEYNETTRFSSANLGVLDKPICYADLGGGHSIPYNVVVRARATLVQVRSFKIEMKDDEPVVTFCFVVADTSGNALIISRSNDLLKKMLNNDKLYVNLLPELGKIDVFNLRVPTTSTTALANIYDVLRMNLEFLLEGILYVEMLCRRLEPNKDDDNDGMPLWYMLDMITIASNQYTMFK